MVKKKSKSKRTTLKDKYKIQKRTVEHHRKAKKQAKRDEKAGIVKHKAKKDPGIPNSWPFKQDLLQEIARARDMMNNKKKTSPENNNNNNNSMQSIMSKAQQSSAQFDLKQQQQENDDNDTTLLPNTTKHSSRRAYWKELNKVVEASDVLLQVLDARDPVGTRIHPSVEDVILSRCDKKMVLVLNKIDLIPPQVLQDWLQYLRKSHATVAVKASTQQTTEHVGQVKGGDNTSMAALQSSLAVGMDGLLQLLKNYARVDNDDKKQKTAIVVGIVGYPNVGKSSIINSLKRSRAVGVSPKPGFTTCMQDVVLDKYVRLLDCPGVVFDDGPGSLLRNCLDVRKMEDPIPAVEVLLRRCNPTSLMMTYNIPRFEGAEMFLSLVARVMGKVLKGGIPNKKLAARAVLSDWNCGKIPYFTVPPKVELDTTSAVVVSSFAKEFDAMDQEVMMKMEEEENKDTMDFVQLNVLDPRHVNDAGVKQAVQYLTNQETMDMQEDEPSNTATAVSNAQMKTAEDFNFDEL